MKKLLLSISTMALAVSGVAQTASEKSCNMPNSTKTGYLFDFNSDATDNCSEDGGAPRYAYSAEHSGMYTYSFSGTTWDIEKDATKEAITEAWRGIQLAFYDGSCLSQGGGIDLDLTGVTTVEIKINSSVAVPQFWFAFRDKAADKWSDNDPDMKPLSVGDNVVTFNIGGADFWKTWVGPTAADGTPISSAAIDFMQLYFRTAWDDNNPSGTFKIDYIKIGDATCNVSAESIESTGGKVFPNPANDAVNVAVTSASTVELTDLTGKVVAAGSSSGASTVVLNTANVPAGVYVVVVKSESGVATSKVVVQ